MGMTAQPCSHCGGTGTEPPLIALKGVRDYMLATGWSPEAAGPAGALWRHASLRPEIGVPHDPGQPYEISGVLDRLAGREGRPRADVEQDVRAAG